MEKTSKIIYEDEYILVKPVFTNDNWLAMVSNKTDKDMVIFFGDSEDDIIDEHLNAYDWFEIYNCGLGKFELECIKNQKFEIKIFKI